MSKKELDPKEEIEGGKVEEEKEEVEEGKEEEGKEEEKVDAEAEAEEAEKMANDISSKIVKTLNLKDLREKVEEISEKSSLAKQIFNVGDVSKDVDKLTGEEKIVAFFDALIHDNKTVLKALAEGVPADGGYLVPEEFRAELIKSLEAPTRMRSLVKVVPMRRLTMKIPKLVSRPNVSWTEENAAKTTTTASFTEKTLTAYKMAAIIYSSEELIEDATDFDLVKIIINLFADRIAEEEDKVITAGSGSGQPTGLTNCTIGSIALSGAMNFDAVIRLIYLLPVQYRVNAKFLTCNANVRDLRLVKDSQNRYIWQDSVVPGQPSTIYGYPVIENNWLPETEMYFGDFKMGYWLGDRKKMTVTVSNIGGDAWSKDQIGIRVVERIAGNCVLEAAMRKLTGIS